MALAGDPVACFVVELIPDVMFEGVSWEPEEEDDDAATGDDSGAS